MQNKLLKKVKATVQALLPDAELLLYGSRSRQDAGPESDWDFLVLTDAPVDDLLTDRIRHQLYEIEWETGEVISVIVRNRCDWNNPPLMTTPFHAKIEKEGIAL